MSASDTRKRRQSDALSENSLPTISKRPRTNHEEDDNDWGDRQICTSGPLSHGDYNVGWICALPIEMAAAKAMLDNIHGSLPGDSNDSNTYTLGNIGMHNIVIACLPSGHYGTNNAATVANNMRRSFPSIQIRLMVGIGGGAPGKVDIRLGDVVVGDKVVQHDFGKTVHDGSFERTGILTRPPQEIMTAVSKLRSDHESSRSQIHSILSEMLERYPSMAKYAYPGPLQDKLYETTYDHARALSSCDQCDPSKLMKRSGRDTTDPRIHYGVIASGNQVIKHAKTRDKLAQELEVLCFEMEAAGLMGSFPCLVIRGICDYSDSHKNKQWQEYAAAAAAAYAKELLSVILPNATPKALTVGTSRAIEQLSLSDRRKALLDSLRFDQIDSRHANIKAAHAKTCRWFLKNPDYVDWLDPAKLSQHHGFLWINGKPGAGKSTLMKFVYTHAKKKAAGNAATIAFFFNARGDDLEKSIIGMHRSLLLQLLEKLPDLQEVLDDSDYAPGNQSSHLTWEVEELQGLFSQAVEKLGQRRVTCFIDALDECDESQVVAMVGFFEDLAEHAVRNQSKLYICFSSRHYPYVDIRTGRKLTLEDQTGHAQDLDRYVQSNLRAGVGKQADEIRAGILQKAAGVFMWVVLVVDILNKEFRRGRIFAVRKRLQEIPAKLSELFKDMLQRDQVNLDDFLLCIQWILYAKRPLRREEFYFAMVSGLDPEPENLVEWNPEHISMDQLQRFVLSSSKGLAEIAKSEIVQFIHESVRDFLIKDGGLRDLWPELGQNFQSLSHDRLKQCCQTYTKVDLSDHHSFDKALLKATSHEAKALRESVSAKFPFLEYAARHILYHADTAANGLAQDEFVKKFPLSAWINLDNLFEKHEIRRHTQNASLLYVLAENGLARLIKTTIFQDQRVHIQGERYRYPLFAALANSHRDAVRVLLQQETSSLSQENDIAEQLEYGTDFTAGKHETPLLWAAKRGRVGLTELLIPSGELDLNFQDYKGRTALSWAAGNGHEAVSKLLLATGEVDPNLSDSRGRTALSWAVGNGHESVVTLLQTIEGVDMHSKDKRGRTILSWAAENEHKAVVKLLLATDGIDVNSKDLFGQTPLIWAARNGKEAVTKLLLATDGVDVDSKDQSGQTPLIWAALNGHEAVIKLLLVTDGVDINSKDLSGQTPLIWAAWNGHEAVTKLLLATDGVDVNSKDQSGQTPLSEAVWCGSEVVIKLLLATDGIDVNSKDLSGETPLIRAARNGQEAVTKLLLATDRIDINSKDKRHKTPLWEATCNGHEAIVRLLRVTGGVGAQPWV
ncbi:ankyrin repeat-containing domain protein [Ilyonectria destructans]|nr:ankyrin repeat-containing domain protein [Ilyonectria destructans]